MDNPLAELLIIFERNGREIERHVAKDGDRAAQMAVVLISANAPLEIGDRITIEEP